MVVRKAVLPVAGLGTRFLPASKSIPKEMVTVVDRPVIDYVVKEAVAAGITQIVLVTHSSKRAIEDYFDRNYELEHTLQQKGKTALLQVLQDIVPPHVELVAVRQPGALGLGHAVRCASSVIGHEPFAVLLPDVLVKAHQGQADLSVMMAHFAQTQQAQIMVEAVEPHLVSHYGVVDIGGQPIPAGQSIGMQRIVEKPAVALAPSNLAVVGRYVLPARIMQLLQHTPAGAGGEIQLTDAIATLMQEQGVAAYRMQGKTFDCGSKLGYLEAILHYAMDDPHLGADFKQLLMQVMSQAK